MKKMILAAAMLDGHTGQRSTAAGSCRTASGVIASHPDWPQANPEDVKSREAIIQALSETISGEAGKPRDWNRFKSPFVPGSGRMIIVRHSKAGPADLLGYGAAG